MTMQPVHCRQGRRRWFCLSLVLGAILSSGAVASEMTQMSFTLTSVAFKEGAAIPFQYTCDGRNLSPPLAWTAPPADTKSFALISDDPDAPVGTWVHWIVYNVPATLRALPEAVPVDAQLADGTRQGKTDFGRTGYGGPCPPIGRHRYFFKLYALDTVLSLAPGATKAQLEAEMKNHVLAQTQLMGTYRHKGR